MNAQEVMQKNDEAWSSFFSLLRMRKERGRLPSFVKRVGPPKYPKQNESGRKKSLLAVRREGYVVDEQGHKPTLKDFGLEVKFAGGLTWLGKGDRLEVYRDEAKNAWHASIPEEVGVRTAKNGNGSKYIFRGERRSVLVESLG